jgi:hypothetical protein
MLTVAFYFEEKKSLVVFLGFQSEKLPAEK